MNKLRWLGCVIIISRISCLVEAQTSPKDTTIAAIQSAADSAASSNSKVVVPPGTYTGSTTLTIPSNVIVECSGWNAVLMFTGASTSVKLGDHSALRNCKVDASNAAPAMEIQATGEEALLDRNWIVGAAQDTQKTHAIRLAGLHSESRSNKYDSVSMVVLQGEGGVSIDDSLVNYRTGIYVSHISNFVVQGTHCVNTSGEGIIAGFDCILVEAGSDGEIDNPVIDASREHGVYIGAKGAGKTESQNIKVVGGTCTGQHGACFKVRGDSVASPANNIQIIATSSDGGIGGNATGIIIANASNVTVDGGRASRQVFGIDIGSGTGIVVKNFEAQLNRGPGLRIRDDNGSVDGVQVVGGKFNNNSFGKTGSFSAIEVRPDNGGSGSGSNLIKNIVIDGIECSDNQTSHTQAHCVEFIPARNGTSVAKMRISNVTGQGNVGPLFPQTPPGYSAVTHP